MAAVARSSRPGIRRGVTRWRRRRLNQEPASTPTSRASAGSRAGSSKRSVDQIRKYFAALHPGTRVERTYQDTEITPQASGVAMVTTLFQTRLLDPQGGGFTFGGALTMTLIERPGGWKILNRHSSSPVRREGAASARPHRPSPGRWPGVSSEERATSGMRVANNVDAPSFAVAGLRLDNDLHVLAERGQKAHQALAGEVRDATIEQGRNLRLIDAHEHCRGNLGQPPALDDLPDVAGKLGLGQLVLRLGETQIGEHVAAAWRHRDVGFLLLGHCS